MILGKGSGTFTGEEHFSKGSFADGSDDLITSLLKRASHVLELFLLHFITAKRTQPDLNTKNDKLFN